ncbi:PDZ domain [Cinara cedri]|uniref:PDZ domain n=1 Tax=Cinara cedri TaxID=506608 RepID=A0A5E4NJD4_9HEMI|nr:PDZ domain [Cinara cedri]
MSVTATAAAAAVAVKDFVTVVSVDGGGGETCTAGGVHQRAASEEDSFVTVLSIGDGPAADAVAADGGADPEEVLVYRLPGERLGFGLRFDGVDTCNRLFVQSCADGSPASRTEASWGPLSAGDEIVRINGRPVNKLSRDDCVRYLKESGLVVKLHMIDGRLVAKAPPPVPPRKQKKPEPPPPIASSAVYTDAVERQPTAISAFASSARFVLPSDVDGTLESRTGRMRLLVLYLHANRFTFLFYLR